MDVQVSKEELGRGFEHTCKWMLKEDGSKGERIARVPRMKWRLLQDKTLEMVQREVDILREEFSKLEGITIDKNFEVLGNIVVIQEGVSREVEYVTTSIFLEDYDERMVNWADLVGSEGEFYTKRLFELVRVEKEIFEKHGCVFDVMGLGEIISVFLEGIPKAAILGISRLMPKILKDLVRANIDGVEGRASNFIKSEEGISCMDPGMYHFSNRFVMDRLAKSYYVFTLTALIELVKYANSLLPLDQQIPSENIVGLEYSGAKFQKTIARFITVNMMIPLFERHRKLRCENANSKLQVNSGALVKKV